jgi:hypothetical protein
MAVRPKTGGRVKGTPNKITPEVRDFCARVLEACGGEELIAKEFLSHEEPDIRLRMFTLLLHYRYGKPKETVDANVTVTDERAERVANAKKFAAERLSEIRRG